MPKLRRRRIRDAEEDGQDEPGKNLLRKAFKLGFEIGYRGHRENLGWVRRNWMEIEAAAKAANVFDECERFYLRGKEVGRRRRSLKMALGEPITTVMEEMPVEAANYELRMFGHRDERTLSAPPRIVETPLVLGSPRSSKVPVMLRLSRLFRPR